MSRFIVCKFPKLLLALLVVAWPAVLHAQTTAFTYQGKLTDAGNPANGSFDLQFKLFDTVTVGAGTQQGATLVRNPVAVSAGVFTVTLDFGANVFSGADRFLEIGVRPAGSVNAYTVLAPRQPLTASPYAIQTLNAQQLGGLPASSYLQNTATPQAGANLNIGGTGTMNSLNVNGPVSLGGIAAPAGAPTGQGRLYFDSTTNKLRVSESGGAFVNLVGATGVSGSGTVNSIPLWSGGTTLGSSLITQSGNIINMPSVAAFAASPSGYQTQIGTPNTETGVTFSGAVGRADIRYNGTLKLVNGPGGIPPDTNGIAITTAGKVGIGTTDPTALLEVKSTFGGQFGISLLQPNGASAFLARGDGSVFIGQFFGSSTTHVCSFGGNLSLCSSAAEYVPTIDDGSGFAETADLVSLAPAVKNPYDDAHAPFVVTKAAKPCDENLLGFIVNPESGADGKKRNDHYLPLAIYGYFPAKVTMENGAIKRGDQITSSSKPGYGMKATQACRIIGYALEDADQEGKIQVFAHLGESAAPQVAALQAQVRQLLREQRTLQETLKTQRAVWESRLTALEQAALRGQTGNASTTPRRDGSRATVLAK